MTNRNNEDPSVLMARHLSLCFVVAWKRRGGRGGDASVVEDWVWLLSFFECSSDRDEHGQIRDRLLGMVPWDHCLKCVVRGTSRDILVFRILGISNRPVRKCFRGSDVAIFFLQVLGLLSRMAVCVAKPVYSYCSSVFELSFGSRPNTAATTTSRLSPNRAKDSGIAFENAPRLVPLPRVKMPSPKSIPLIPNPGLCNFPPKHGFWGIFLAWEDQGDLVALGIVLLVSLGASAASIILCGSSSWAACLAQPRF